MDQVEVWRGRHGDPVPLFGPLPGVRAGDTLGYEFELSSRFTPWPGRTLLERVFVLLDLGVSMSLPPWRGLAELTGIIERGELAAFLRRTCPAGPLDPPIASPADHIPVTQVPLLNKENRASWADAKIYALGAAVRRRAQRYQGLIPKIGTSDADVTDGAFTRRYGAAPAVPRADP